ncbi:MAG: hypothetical protein GF365_05480 [Candidatus Buchananbacteria bacterium]|nr:hypothetical protein [Candidatus Buchananbacteria bacterium]
MKNKKQKLAVLTLVMLGFFICPPTTHALDQEIIISEISAYLPSNFEWLEIYNKSSEPIDLTDWKFYENETNHGLNVFQGDLIIEAQEYAIIADVPENFLQDNPDFNGTIIDSSWSSLKEEGEEIALINEIDEIIEIFTYLPCPDTSLQKINLDLNDYSEINWQIHADSHSAGQANQFDQANEDGQTQEETEENITNENDDQNIEETEDEPIIISPGTILINEFVSDPISNESEWIELYNTNSFAVDLTDWTIEEGSGATINLKETIDSQSFHIIELSSGKLNNSGDVIILKNNNETMIDTVFYGDWENNSNNAPAATDPLSTARISDGYNTNNYLNDFAVTQTPTKNESNLITLPQNETEDDFDSSPAQEDKKEKLDYKKIIMINEIYPNPLGADSHYEFIELKNIGEQEINLTSWQIQDADKNNYKIKAADFSSTIIKPTQYFVITRKISGLALNNDKETIKLISPGNKTIQTIKYSEEPELNENASFAIDKIGDWHWTATVTKGQANIINLMNHPPIIEFTCPKKILMNETVTCDASDSYDLENDDLAFNWQIENQIYPNPIFTHQFAEKGDYQIQLIISDQEFEVKEVHKIKISNPDEETADTKNSKIKSQTKNNEQPILEVKLDQAKNLTLKTKIKTKGIVSVLPNTFGKTTMYLNLKNSAGIQLYMYKADWPKLKIGDLVDVAGEISESKGEKRIKLSSKDDLTILENQGSPEAKQIMINEIGEEIEGYLVQIQGQLIEKSGSRFYVQDETGEAEIYIKQKTKITKSNFKEGDNLTITGIVSQNDDIYQILPRSNDDFIKNQEINQADENLKISQNIKSNQVLNYLIPTAIFLAISLMAIFYKKKPQKISS